MVPEQIEREIVIAAPVERVWEVITEAEHLGTWFGDDGAEIDLRPGGTLTLRWKEHGTYHTTIEKIEPRRFFSFRGAINAGEETRADNSTLVEFSLTPEGNGTRLRVVERGFRQLAMSEEKQAEHAAGNTRGWIVELDELRQYLLRPAA